MSINFMAELNDRENPTLLVQASVIISDCEPLPWICYKIHTFIELPLFCNATTMIQRTGSFTWKIFVLFANANKTRKYLGAV